MAGRLRAVCLLFLALLSFTALDASAELKTTHFQNYASTVIYEGEVPTSDEPGVGVLTLHKRLNHEQPPAMIQYRGTVSKVDFDFKKTTAEVAYSFDGCGVVDFRPSYLLWKLLGLRSYYEGQLKNNQREGHGQVTWYALWYLPIGWSTGDFRQLNRRQEDVHWTGGTEVKVQKAIACARAAEAMAKQAAEKGKKNPAMSEDEMLRRRTEL
jgi:hypothetical protein